MNHFTPINMFDHGTAKTVHTSASEPLPLEREMEKAENYPLHSLGDIMGPAARAMNESIQAPDALCAHSVLGFATQTVQGHANIEIDDRIEPLTEFFLSIGSSSARKTACYNKAGKVHMETQKKLWHEYQESVKVHSDSNDAYKQSQKAIKSSRGTMQDKTDQLVVLQKEEPEQPYDPQVVLSDSTIEGLHKLFLKGTPSKFLCADEGGQFAGGYSMSAEKKKYTATIYSKYWDGAEINQVRSGDGSSILYGKRLSMLLMMQDKIAADFFNDETMRNQGLISRFLCAYPESLKGKRQYQEKDVSICEEMTAFYTKVQENLDVPMPLKINEKTGRKLNEVAPRTICLENNAKQAWISIYNEIESESGAGGQFESIEGFAGKAAAHILRLAGIIALFEDITRETVPLKYMENAIYLMRYYLKERLRISAMAEPDMEIEKAKKLLKWIQKKGLKVVTLPDVYGSGPRACRSSKKARASVKILEEHFWLTSKTEGGVSEFDGRKSNNAWTVNNG